MKILVFLLSLVFANLEVELLTRKVELLKTKLNLLDPTYTVDVEDASQQVIKE